MDACRWLSRDAARRLGAPAAGDVLYGGLFDLVIISATDQRDGVVARFCIARRSRMQAAG